MTGEDLSRAQYIIRQLGNIITYLIDNPKLLP
jgi:hypothetical protein